MPIEAAPTDTVDPKDADFLSDASLEDTPSPTGEKPRKHSTARDLLKHAGAWVGDDLQERLDEVYATRGIARF